MKCFRVSSFRVLSFRTLQQLAVTAGLLALCSLPATVRAQDATPPLTGVMRVNNNLVRCGMVRLRTTSLPS